jgi:hypothetical protein
MVEVDWDGTWLKIHGTNKLARVALAGEDHATDPIIIAAGQIAQVVYNAPKMFGATNGQLDVHTVAGKRYKLHFRKKSTNEFEWLAKDLQGATA